MTHLVTLVYQLMGSCNQFEAIDMVKLARDLVTKEPARSTGADGPRLYIFRI